MRTTLTIDDSVMTRVRHAAARQGRTTSELVETALRGYLAAPHALDALAPHPAVQRGDRRVSTDVSPDAIAGC